MRLTYLALTHELFPSIYLFIFYFKEKPVATRVISSNLETYNFRSKSKKTYSQHEYTVDANLCWGANLWCCEGVCNIMWAEMLVKTQACHLWHWEMFSICFLVEVQANHQAGLHAALALLYFKTVSLFCYTDFMARKTVAAVSTFSFADLKGLVWEQRNQRQLQWAHRDHRTLLMVGWVLSTSPQGNLAISIRWWQVPTGIASPRLPQLGCVSSACFYEQNQNFFVTT